MIGRKALAGLMDEKKSNENKFNLEATVNKVQKRNQALREAAGGCGPNGCQQTKGTRKVYKK